MMFESSHTAGIGSGVTKDVAGNVLWSLLCWSTQVVQVSISHLNRQVPPQAVLRQTQLHNPFVPGTSVDPNVVCATGFPQCDMRAYVLAIQAYAHVHPVSYTHPTWICKASQLHESIVSLKLVSRSIYNGLSRMSWSSTKLLQALQNIFWLNTSPLLCSSSFPLAQTHA